jgi:peroxiredoxin
LPCEGRNDEQKKLTKAVVYQIALHTIIVVLAIETAVLVYQNNELKANDGMLIGEIKADVGFPLSEINSLMGSGQISDNRGKLIYVFTTTCPYCERNLVRWNDIATVATANGLEVIGISLSSVEQTKAYANEHHVTFPIYVASNPKSFRSEHRIKGVPITMVCSKNQVVDKLWIGALDDDRTFQILDAVSSNSPLNNN